MWNSFEKLNLGWHRFLFLILYFKTYIICVCINKPNDFVSCYTTLLFARIIFRAVLKFAQLCVREFLYCANFNTSKVSYVLFVYFIIYINKYIHKYIMYTNIYININLSFGESLSFLENKENIKRFLFVIKCQSNWHQQRVSGVCLNDTSLVSCKLSLLKWFPNTPTQTLLCDY